jgi:hypothetical protein
MHTGMTDADPHKIRENRLRRMAERQGLKLEKSRRRQPRARAPLHTELLGPAGLQRARHLHVAGQEPPAQPPARLAEVVEFRCAALPRRPERSACRLLTKASGPQVTVFNIRPTGGWLPGCDRSSAL